jgi:hypothetical protein
MDHKESVAKKMAESYLLNELTPEQRDAFEEHYFGCPECARDVKAGAMFVANVKEVLHAEPASEVATGQGRSRSGWLSWLQPAYGLAAALALALVVYQNTVTIPRLRERAQSNTPQALAAFTVFAGSRGATVPNVRVEPKQSFELYIDVPPSDNFASYRLEVQSENGVSQFSVPVSAEAAKEAVPLLITGGLLEPGKYVVILRGYQRQAAAAETEIQHYPFSLEFKK